MQIFRRAKVRKSKAYSQLIQTSVYLLYGFLIMMILPFFYLFWVKTFLTALEIIEMDKNHWTRYRNRHLTL